MVVCNAAMLLQVRFSGSKEGLPVTSVRELTILQQARHPNIVSLLKVVTGTRPDRQVRSSVVILCQVQLPGGSQPGCCACCHASISCHDMLGSVSALAPQPNISASKASTVTHNHQAPGENSDNSAVTCLLSVSVVCACTAVSFWCLNTWSTT